MADNSAPKKLFDQELVTEYDNYSRIAFGTPEMEGCQNMLMSVFINKIINSVQQFIKTMTAVNSTEYRSGTETVVAGDNTIQFKNAIGDAYPFSIDTGGNYILFVDDNNNGLGLKKGALTKDGFVITSNDSGSFNYIAIVK